MYNYYSIVIIKKKVVKGAKIFYNYISNIMEGRMPQETLNRLKQFESILKKILEAKFGKYMSEDKVSLFNAKNYITEELLKNNVTGNAIQGDILRTMLDDIINIDVMKEFNVKDYGVISFMYGRMLENGIIEYYAMEISKEHKFNINEVSELKDNLELATLLIEKLGDKAIEEIMTSDAVKLLGIPGLEEASKNYTKKEVKAAVAKKNLEKKLATTTEEELLKASTSRINSIQLVDLNDKKHIKYIDKEGKVHLVEATESIVEYYQTALGNLKPGEELDPEVFFSEITKLTDEIHLQKTEDVDKDRISGVEISMLDFVYSNPDVLKETKKDVITHSSDNNIHVVESTNDIIVTDTVTGGNRVEATKVEDGKNMDETGKESQPVQTDTDMTEKVLSPSEYEELCMKFANNQELTIEELRALRYYTPGLLSDEEREEMKENIEKGPVLKMNSGNAAFANKNMIIYVVAITVLVGIFLGALLFKITNS